MSDVLLIIVVIVVVLNIATTRAVSRSHQYDGRQKVYQFALIWLIPVLGSVISYSFLKEPVGERLTTDLTDKYGSGDYDRTGGSLDASHGDGGGGGDA